MKKPTLIDVGKESGVSAITVSRALRGPDRVSKALRDRVFAAVEKLGYVPDAAASTLASKTVFSDWRAGTFVFELRLFRRPCGRKQRDRGYEVLGPDRQYRL